MGTLLHRPTAIDSVVRRTRMWVLISVIKRVIDPFILSWLLSTDAIVQHIFISIVEIVVIITAISVVMLSHLCSPETLQVLHNICENVSLYSTIIVGNTKSDDRMPNKDYEQPLP
jgi:ABC-type sugar transport system permease subunit